MKGRAKTTRRGGSSKPNARCYSKSGSSVQNSRATAAARKPANARSRNKVYNPTKYAATVKHKSMTNVAQTAVKNSSSAKRVGHSKPTTTTVSSKRSTGCYTKSGSVVRNPRAYNDSSPKSTTYTRSGNMIHNPAKYTAAVQNKSITNAARAAVKRNPSAKAFTYTASLPGQKKYIGMTTNPLKRISDHSKGTGAKCIKENLTAVTITPHSSVAAAKKKETKTYFDQKKKMGIEKVRGAGHTKQF